MTTQVLNNKIQFGFDIDYLDSNILIKIVEWYISFKQRLKDFSSAKYRNGLRYVLSFIFNLIMTIILTPLLLTIVPIIFAPLYENLTRKIVKEKNSSISKIRLLPFDKIQEIEKSLDLFLNITGYIKSDLYKMENNIFFKSIAKNILIIISVFKELKLVCKEQYSFSKSLFDNEQDFNEYFEAMKHMSDVWDYPSPRETQKVVFKNNKLTSNA